MQVADSDYEQYRLDTVLGTWICPLPPARCTDGDDARHWATFA
ncbi:hypothetical protein [Rhodococcus opacus]|nr:hypothetical protein [Rhodococcus opacus]